MQYKILLTVLLVVFIGVNSSFARGESDMAGEEWNPLSVGPITTWTAPVCEKGKLIVQPFFFFNRANGVFDDESHYKPFKDKDSKWQWQEELFLTYGLTDRLEIDAQGTYQQNIRKIGGASAESTGFGDTYIYSSYCLLMEKGWLPCIAAWFQLKIPTGKYQKADIGKLGTDLMGANSGGGSYDHGYGFIVTKKIKPFVLHADAIWNFPVVTRVDGVKTEYAPYARYDLGLEYFFYRGFNLVVELNGLIQGDSKEDGSPIPSSNYNYLTISPGIGWSCKEIQMLLAYQRTLAGTNADANDSIVFTFAHAF